MVAALSHGVEQELQLVEPRTGGLRRDARDAVIDALRARQGSHAYAGYGPDGYPSQLEYWVGVARTLEELENLLVGFRRACVQACEANGVAVVALGVNPIDRTETDGENFGEHHHVGVSSATEARRYHNLVRLFVPELVALSANSRWYAGGDTKKASFRLFRTRHCAPAPWLGSSMDRDIVLASKRPGGGGMRRFWDVTPFVKCGRTTVEVRLCDVGPSVGATVGIAALLQALLNRLRSGVDVCVGELPTESAEPELAANRAAAIDNGLGAEFVRKSHPVFGRKRAVTARAAVEELATWLRGDLEACDPRARRWVDLAVAEAERAQAVVASSEEVFRSSLSLTRQV